MVAAGTWPSPSGPLWTPAEDAMLGTMPDGQLAARIGRTAGSVAARRHKLRIPPACPPGRQHGYRKNAHPNTRN
jgi:hypothetical protein